LGIATLAAGCASRAEAGRGSGENARPLATPADDTANRGEAADSAAGAAGAATATGDDGATNSARLVVVNERESVAAGSPKINGRGVTALGNFCHQTNMKAFNQIFLSNKVEQTEDQTCQSTGTM
jgi:hypothetical protein